MNNQSKEFIALKFKEFVESRLGDFNRVHTLSDIEKEQLLNEFESFMSTPQQNQAPQFEPYHQQQQMQLPNRQYIPNTGRSLNLNYTYNPSYSFQFNNRFEPESQIKFRLTRNELKIFRKCKTPHCKKYHSPFSIEVDDDFSQILQLLGQRFLLGQ